MIKSKKESTEETFAIMQCGDLDINFEIQYGILILGMTGVGKTASAYYLKNQSLIGCSSMCKGIVYEVEEEDELHRTARISNSEFISETQIPNFFPFKQHNEDVFLIDCPGYRNSFGYLRQLSNRFFLHKIFSKVQKVKFLITFCYEDMNKTATLFKECFMDFFNGFKNIEQIKKEIYKCANLLVTIVPRNLEEAFSKQCRQKWKNEGKNGLVEAVKQKIRFVSGFQMGEYTQFFKGLLESILNEDRVFIFEQAIIDKCCNKQNKILKQIGQRSQYWQRNKIHVYVPNFQKHKSSSVIKYFQNQKQKMQINMQNINISMTPTLKYEFIKNESDLIQEYYNEKIIPQISHLRDVINQIVVDLNDNFENIKEPKFFKMIKQFNQQNQSKNSFCIQLFKNYEKKRKQAQLQLFQTFDLFGEKYDDLKQNKKISVNQIQKTSFDMPSWLFKLKTYGDILEINSISCSIQNFNLQKISLFLKKDLDLVYNLCTQIKLENQDNNSTKNNMVLEYLYKLYQNVNIINRLSKIMKNPIFQPKKELKYISFDTDYLTKAFILSKSISKDCIWRNIDKMSSLNFSSNTSEQILKYLNVLLNKLVQDQEKQNEFFENDSDKPFSCFKQKFEMLFVKLKISAFSNRQFLQKFPLKQMLQVWQEISQKMNQSQNKNPLILRHNQVLQYIAQKLELNEEYQLAIEIYKALHDCHSCLLIFEKQLKMFRQNPNKDQPFQTLIQYANIAKRFRMLKQAREKANEAHNLAQKYGDQEKLKRIKKFIYNNFVKPVPEDDDKMEEYQEYLRKQDIPAAIVPKNVYQQLMKLIQK